MKRQKNLLQNVDALLNKQQPTRCTVNNDLLEHNIKTLASIYPNIHHEFSQYQFKKSLLMIDNQELNLIQDDKPYYPIPAKSFAKKQVQAYLDSPIWLGSTISHVPQRFYQYQFSKKITSSIQSSIDTFQGDIKKEVGLCIIFGVGLGYHIESLLSKINCQHLCIIEPDTDCFYASLNALDWQKIKSQFEKQNQSLQLFVNRDNLSLEHELNMVVRCYGKHISNNAFYYNHVDSDKARETFDLVQSLFNKKFSYYGFFEDEQICLAHTVANIQCEHHILLEKKSNQTMPPIFIIGNGPSLDQQYDLIRQYQDRCIIMSCGSTLGTLKKEDIIPDFQVEMERTYETTLLYKEALDLNYTQKINLLCLSSVANETTSFFKRVCVAAKAMDPSLTLLESVTDSRVALLKYANPTCTNTGLAFALAMGFTEIYLLGVDLGMKDLKQHHAKASRYFDNSSQFLNVDILSEDMYQIKGNLSQYVHVSPVLDLSRHAMEQLIQVYHDVNIYNLNDGAYINGTLPLAKEKLNIKASDSPIFNKETFITELLNRHSHKPQTSHELEPENFKQTYLLPAIDTIRSLRDDVKSLDIDNIIQCIDKYQAQLRTLYSQDNLAYSLINGTIMNLFSILHLGVILLDDTGEQETFIKESRHLTVEFLDYCMTILTERPLMLDNSEACFKYLQE